MSETQCAAGARARVTLTRDTGPRNRVLPPAPFCLKIPCLLLRTSVRAPLRQRKSPGVARQSVETGPRQPDAAQALRPLTERIRDRCAGCSVSKLRGSQHGDSGSCDPI